MKIKIVSDGTAIGTRLIDADTGADLSKDLACTRLECDAQDGLMVARLTIAAPLIDVIVPATLCYDPDDIDSISQAIAELERQRAARMQR